MQRGKGELGRIKYSRNKQGGKERIKEIVSLFEGDTRELEKERSS